jgi:adenylate cyclase
MRGRGRARAAATSTQTRHTNRTIRPESKLGKYTGWADTLRAVKAIVEREQGRPLSEDASRALANVLQEPRAAYEASAPFIEHELTILLADLRGFTSLSENHPARVTLEVLNGFLARMSGVIRGNGGTIEKFMGDSIMALFGLPTPRRDDALRAVRCAVEMQAALEELNEHYARRPLPRLYMGIGISSGAVMTGMLGSADYSEHAVIGDDVNLASRIEAVSLRGQVLISETTYARCRDEVETGEPLAVYVKGKLKPITIREVTGIPSLGLQVRRNDLRASPRVNVNLPFRYFLVRGKVVMSEPMDGMIMDLSYHGAAVRLPREHPPHTEIKLDLSIPFIGVDVRGIYARIIRTRGDGDGYICGMEFTSVAEEDAARIQQFVHYLLQSDPELRQPER